MSRLLKMNGLRKNKFLLVIIALVLIGVFVKTNYSRPTVLSSTSPTLFQFQEITIPYLRKRNFQSKLAPLKKQTETETYTEYLTSYDSDGLQINCLLTIPKGTPPESGWPGVVFVHGYIPPEKYQTTKSYATYVNALAQKGVAVMKIDLRGHAKSQGDPGGGYFSADYVVDTLNAYTALKQYHLIDPQKISLWGHSMAGNLVFRSLVANKGIRKIVIWAGAGYTYDDMRLYKIADKSYRPLPETAPAQKKLRQLYSIHGQFDSDNFFWKQVVPVNYLEDVEGVIQVHHAVDDQVVSIDYSRNLMDILDMTSIEHWLFEYPSGGHNMTGKSFDLAIDRTAEFVKN